MSTSNNNYSILPWYDAVSRQNHRKSYAQGQVWPLISKINRLPCFQIYREALGTPGVPDPITTFTITHIESGTVYNILATSGLGIEQYSPPNLTAYDLIVYTGQYDAPGTFKEGQYEGVISDGTNTWYSERFFMRSYLGDLIKISYWHDVPFLVPLHHISYREPFYNFLYLNSEINRPAYPEEEEVVERDGYRFPIFQVSKKTFRIVGLLLPEFMCDALRLLWMHHYCTVEFDGITYYPDSIRVIYGEWEKPGHLCGVTIEFVTDTVATQTGFIKNANDGGDYDQTDYNDDHLIS